jgi:hypothetical protein
VRDNNDNVNVLLQNNNINDNDNVSSKSGFDKSKYAESIARKLVAKFDAPGSFSFYCKVAYSLPENRIWNNYEQATTSKKVKNPAGLFNWLCRKDMT